ncbi:hypothetical protein EG68_07034 [Paragonimus skrjabini miyazakii]|uniref:Coiled-coil domain-containing protein 148 n=1 Tax=Paragonimus skrjabini miyazakii TaxID=59628 RepID=A0A8S9YGE5_9TREM|nr:hypothetical protein EG68_07034 [Paragonimus skrjabini miyazakii]
MDHRSRFRNLKPISYDALHEITERFKSKSKHIEAKITALSEARQQIKNSQLPKNLAKVWHEECIRLRGEERKANISIQDHSHKWILEVPTIVDTIEMLEKEEQEFQDTLLKPVWTLRDDLKYWMVHKKNGQLTADYKPVLKVVEDMNDAIRKLWDVLKAEQISCEHSDSDETNNPNGPAFSVSQKSMGIPDEAWQWSTPNDEFLAELLAEFIHVDVIFFNQLEYIRAEYDQIHAKVTDNWDPEDVNRIDYFWDVFQRRAGNNWRKLAFKFLGRVCADRSVAEIECLLNCRMRQNQLKDQATTIKRSWVKAREDLTIRIKASLLQAMELVAQKRLEKEQLRTQRELCLFLQDQVKRWREEKAELIELEEREQTKIREQEQALRSIQKAKHEAERQMTKAKVTAYREMKTALRNRQQERETTRLAKLRDIHEKQARIDAARLLEAEKSRLYTVQQKRLLARERAELEAKQMRDHLEGIRKKAGLARILLFVRPVVKSDPKRIISETESWKIKLDERRKDKQYQCDDATEAPSRLVSTLTTFTDTKLYTDRRTRLTAALHSAGLLDSNYARALLATVPSDRPTRKDNQTSNEMKLTFSSEA